MINPWKSMDWNPTAKKIRLTLVSIALSAVLIAWIIRRESAGPELMRYGWCGLVLLLLGAVVPAIGRWICRAWYLLSGAVGFVVSNLILVACFYLVITPLALVRRATGGCPLNLKPGPNDSSWEDHADKTADPASYFRQF